MYLTKNFRNKFYRGGKKSRRLRRKRKVSKKRKSLKKYRTYRGGAVAVREKAAEERAAAVWAAYARYKRLEAEVEAAKEVAAAAAADAKLQPIRQPAEPCLSTRCSSWPFDEPQKHVVDARQREFEKEVLRWREKAGRSAVARKEEARLALGRELAYARAQLSVT